MSLTIDPFYHLATYTFKGRVTRSLKNLLPEIDGGNILDWGCSQGMTTREISEIYPTSNVIGIDLNPEAIQRARSLNEGIGNLEFVVGDGYDHNFENIKFDAVFAMNNLVYGFEKIYHYEKELARVRKSIQHIGSLVKNGGCLIISKETNVARYDKDSRGFITIGLFRTNERDEYQRSMWKEKFMRIEELFEEDIELD